MRRSNGEVGAVPNELIELIRLVLNKIVRALLLRAGIVKVRVNSEYVHKQ